jgi:hypothetical protein
MSMRALLSLPMPVRRRVYGAFLAASLLSYFLGGALLKIGKQTLAVDLLLLAVTAAQFAALLWLRPRRLPYALGVVCLLLAFVSAWLAGDRGGLVREMATASLPPAVFSWLFTALFLLGWHLLAESFAKWWVGAATYLGAGLLLVVLIIVPQLPFALGGRSWPGFPGMIFFWLLWPAISLALLNAFGWRFD